MVFAVLLLWSANRGESSAGVALDSPEVLVDHNRVGIGVGVGGVRANHGVIGVSLRVCYLLVARGSGFAGVVIGVGLRVFFLRFDR